MLKDIDKMYNKAHVIQFSIAFSHTYELTGELLAFFFRSRTCVLTCRLRSFGSDFCRCFRFDPSNCVSCIPVNNGALCLVEFCPKVACKLVSFAVLGTRLSLLRFDSVSVEQFSSFWPAYHVVRRCDRLSSTLTNCCCGVFIVGITF